MLDIIITGPVSDFVEKKLSDFGRIVVLDDITENSILNYSKNAVAIVCRGEAVITRNIIEAAPYLRVIGRTGVGVDSIDIPAATEKGIPVINTPGANSLSVAEGALTLTLMMLKEILHWNTQVHSGNWASRYKMITRDIQDSSLGIVGFGNIGRKLTTLALPLGLNVLATDPFVSSQEANKLGVELLELEELLAKSDVVTLHTTLTDETRGIINNKTIKLMKQGAFLINLGRGGLIADLDILYEALKSEHLRAVALNTFEPEPPDLNHPIFGHERCVCSPHVIGLTPAAMNNIYSSMTEDMVKILTNKLPKFCVNSETLNH